MLLEPAVRPCPSLREKLSKKICRFTSMALGQSGRRADLLAFTWFLARFAPEATS